jgi:hypothetical protein
VIAAVRGGKAYHAPDPQFRFEAGDMVVVVGTPESIAKAAVLFRKLEKRARRTGQLRMTGKFRASGSVMFYPEGDTTEHDTRTSHHEVQTEQQEGPERP